MKVLIVEDDDVLQEVLRGLLEVNGFAVDVVADGEEGLYMAEEFTPDAMVLDVILPSLDGISLVKCLRQKGNAVPVLLLTVNNDIPHRIEGLDCGADDYLAKPFDHGELLARLRAIIRRTKHTPNPIITIGDLEVNTALRSVTRAGHVIALTAREYNLLEYLAINRNRVLSRAELLAHLYHSEFEPESNLIDVYITLIRNKIDKPFQRKLIHTVRGAGYLLRVPRSDASSLAVNECLSERNLSSDAGECGIS